MGGENPPNLCIEAIDVIYLKQFFIIYHQNPPHHPIFYAILRLINTSKHTNE